MNTEPATALHADRDAKPPKIVVIGAHAGDCEVMTGSVVAQHTAAGGAATFVHLTLGERGHPSRSSDAYGAQKREEAHTAAEAVGAQVRILPFRDGDLVGDRETKHAVAEIIRDERPEIVITHWAGSFHRDHAICHEIVCDAVFYAGLADVWPDRRNHLIRALYFGENWEDARGFHPDLYVDTTDGHEQWLGALQAYELFRGGLSSFPYVSYYAALATVRGAECGCTYAKAFAVPDEARRVVVRSLDRGIPLPVTTAASIVVHPSEGR
jgi:LmbE family N-acetylglucosaminyl deacetylase